MKVLTVKEMNKPGDEALRAFHRRLALIALKNEGEEFCKRVIENAKEKKA